MSEASNVNVSGHKDWIAGDWRINVTGQGDKWIWGVYGLATRSHHHHRGGETTSRNEAVVAALDAIDAVERE